MAQKDQKLIFERAPYVDLVVGPGSCTRFPNCSKRLPQGAARGWRSASTAPPAAARRSNRASRATIRCAIRADAAHAVPGVRADHDRLRQVLHLLHRPHACAGRSRAARPRDIVAEVRKLADEGCREITLAGPDRQQLPPPGRRPHDPLVRSARSAARDRRHRPHQVRHQLSQGHDRRPAAGRSRSAQVLALSARAVLRAARTKCCGG